MPHITATISSFLVGIEETDDAILSLGRFLKCLTLPRLHILSVDVQVDYEEPPWSLSWAVKEFESLSLSSFCDEDSELSQAPLSYWHAVAQSSWQGNHTGGLCHQSTSSATARYDSAESSIESQYAAALSAVMGPDPWEIDD
ncbi:hypothetical protein C8R43DRAFT_1130918 [Mycena crocata]|nr:hypothetical protein C8R43DRAFT_1130918 [Mycena crocata]